MDAFNNCAGRSKEKDQLVLPRGHGRSLKSALTCGITSGTNETKPTVASSNVPKMHDPFNYDSASMTRDLFKGFILRRQDSLTIRECTFLESLVEDAGEDDLNNAMMALSDTELFFHPNERLLDRSASGFLGRDDSDRQRRKDECCSIVGASTSSSHLGANKENTENHTIKRRVADTEDLSVEIIDSRAHGAIILQDLGNPPVKQKPTKAKSEIDFESPTVTMNKKGLVTPAGRKQRRMSLPANLGSSHRISRRALERGESSVHQGMWKAHKQGISLTPQTPFQSTQNMNKTISFRHTLFTGQHSRTTSPFKGGHSPSTSGAHSRGKSPSFGRLTSTSQLHSNLTQRNDLEASISSLPSLHQDHHFNSSTASMISDTCSDFHSRQDYVHQMRDSMSTINTIELFDASVSSIPGLDLATPIYDSNSFALPYYTPRESPSQRGSQMLGDSLSSFSALHRRGRSLGDSVTSFPSLHPSQPLRQTPNGSIPSIPLSRPLIRGLSHVSSASESSITLKSLHNVYQRRTSNGSVGSKASFRYQVPMRPLKNPSPLKTLRNPGPLGRPVPPVHRRTVSDSAVPRFSSRPVKESQVKEEDADASTSSSSTAYHRPRVYVRRGSIACKFLFLLM